MLTSVPSDHGHRGDFFLESPLSILICHPEDASASFKAQLKGSHLLWTQSSFPGTLDFSSLCAVHVTHTPFLEIILLISLFLLHSPNTMSSQKSNPWFSLDPEYLAECLPASVHGTRRRAPDMLHPHASTLANPVLLFMDLLGVLAPENGQPCG